MAYDFQHLLSIEHPLALGSFRNWMKLLRDSGGVDREFLPRIAMVSFSSFLTSPLRIAERFLYAEQLKQVELHPSPIFIVGHWRTGTTHLHNLLCQDKNFGFVSTFQTLAPGFYLTGKKNIKPILAQAIKKNHPTRMIDNIPLSFDAPQEEDFAMANLCPYSFLHLFTFPRLAEYYFKRYALFEGITAEAVSEWKEIYLGLLRKASYGSNGKRLVIKGPANSGRIPALLELFPEAKFIHITRNPYDVFPSTLWVYQILLPKAQLQRISWEKVEEYVLAFYSLLMHKFLADKNRIPPQNLVELRFEDLEKSPLDQLQRIYRSLDLPGFTQAEPAFRSYQVSTNGYRKNHYQITGEVIKKVNDHWQFTLDEWGYQRIE